MPDCKICNSRTELYGVCDFNKNCEERHGVYLPLSGVPVYYEQCTNCGFIFSRLCDDWAADEYEAKIYNSDYPIVDPLFEGGERAQNDADIVMQYFSPTTLLDYGGGRGHLARTLNTHGFTAETYDPFFNKQLPTEKYKVVTNFESIEHSADPHAFVKDLCSFLATDGFILFSTLAVDFLEPRAMDAAAGASFIAPRNGHISIYTTASISNLFSQYGFNVRSLPQSNFINEDNRVFIVTKK